LKKIKKKYQISFKALILKKARDLIIDKSLLVEAIIIKDFFFIPFQFSSIIILKNNNIISNLKSYFFLFKKKKSEKNHQKKKKIK
jgi:hypothetical protein